jgi:methyl-accepting chemotaxis protein
MKVINDNFLENEWNKEGKKITVNMNNFQKLKKELSKKIDYVKSSNIDNNDIHSYVEKIESELENAKTNIEPMILKIKNKISTYANNFEIAANQEQKEEKGEELIMDLMNNKDVLEERRKNLQDIHQTAAQMKEITDKMALDVNQQGAILDDIEGKVIDSEDKANKARQEIEEANKISKSNKKCVIFYILIIIGGLVGLGLLGYGIYKLAT